MYGDQRQSWSQSSRCGQDNATTISIDGEESLELLQAETEDLLGGDSIKRTEIQQHFSNCAEKNVKGMRFTLKVLITFHNRTLEYEELIHKHKEDHAQKVLTTKMLLRLIS